MFEPTLLPIIFVALMGLSILVYAILDGYDLGVGILLPRDSRAQRDTMIASIGPFWDANETWLVLAVGLLLVAFPSAHNILMYELYLPAALLLAGLILRGVAFDFRAKASTAHQDTWDLAFKGGSLLATLTQGYMLGQYVIGFEQSLAAEAFAMMSAVCVTAAYAYIGGAWLVMKTEGQLQLRAARWTRYSGWLAGTGIATISLLNPLISERLFEKWLGMPQALLLFPLPIICAAFFIMSDQYLKRMPHRKDFGCWIPFVGAVMIFFLCFLALAYSYYPYVIPDQLTVWEAASSPESLSILLVGTLFVFPVIIGYTIFAYRVFWGKATKLRYY